MTAEKYVYIKQINELIADIQKKDDRFSVSKLERDVFEKEHIIANAISRYSKSCYSIDRYRFIISRLTEYRDSIKDYSMISTNELIKKSKNLIKNKGYTLEDVSAMMGKNNNYISARISEGKRSPILNIYDFAKMLPEKSYQRVVENIVKPEVTIATDGLISIIKLTLNGNVYYLENVQDEKLMFSASRDNAEWFNEEPSIETEIINGKKKTVIEFEN